MKRYSRISSVNRFFSFIPAALRMVRIDLAVLPCFPMTLPRSLWATLNSRTVVCSPSIGRTETCSGLSTRAFAICSMSSFIATPRINFAHWLQEFHYEQYESEIGVRKSLLYDFLLAQDALNRFRRLCTL